MATHREVLDASEAMATAWGSMAEHAATIAHARMVMYQAYLAEGFKPHEALELCKTI